MNSESESLMKAEVSLVDQQRNETLMRALGEIAYRMVDSSRVGTRDEAAKNLMEHLADVFAMRESRLRLNRRGQEIREEIVDLVIACDASGMPIAAEHLRDAASLVFKAVIEMGK